MVCMEIATGSHTLNSRAKSLPFPWKPAVLVYKLTVQACEWLLWSKSNFIKWDIYKEYMQTKIYTVYMKGCGGATEDTVLLTSRLGFETWVLKMSSCP